MSKKVCIATIQVLIDYEDEGQATDFMYCLMNDARILDWTYHHVNDRVSPESDQGYCHPSQIEVSDDYVEGEHWNGSSAAC